MKGKHGTRAEVRMQQSVHLVVHRRSGEVAVDLANHGVLVGARQMHLLAKLVVFVKAGLAGKQNAVAVGEEFGNPLARGTRSDCAHADDLNKAAAAENNAAGAFGIFKCTSHF